MSDTPFGEDSRMTDTQGAFVRGYRAAVRDLDSARASIEDELAISSSTVIERMVYEVEHNCLTRMINEMSLYIDRVEGDFVAINDTEGD